MVSDLSFSLLFIIWRPSLFFLCFSQFCFLCASPTFVFVCVSPTFHFQFFTSQFCLLYVSPTLAFFIICVPFLLFWCFSCFAFYLSLPRFLCFFFTFFCLLCVSSTFALLPNSPSSLWEPSRKVSSKRLLPAFSENEKERIFDSHKYNNTAIDWFSTTTSTKHKT